MKFIILSKYKIDAVENKLTEFIAEDLISSIEESSSIVVCPQDNNDHDKLIKDIKSNNLSLKFKYIITIERCDK